MENTLYYGDNLEILRDHIKDETIDLIYLDPPFNSKRDYNILFGEKNGSKSHAQIKAFEDSWYWDMKAEETYVEIVENLPKKIADLIKALRSFLGENDMMAYLIMMTIRLQELDRVLKPTGSIYLHCDPTASHYLKLVMDAIFGNKQFMNEIIWYYGPKATQRSISFQRKHDIIFFYTKQYGKNFFNPLLQEYGKGSLKERAIRYKHKDEHGVYRLTTRRDSKGNKYRAKVYLKEGVMMTDVWQIPVINATSKERLGYPTQKPEALLERILKASSNEGDLILDPFCGCGTTITVAEKLKRNWIGIDITHLAISLMKHRLEDSFFNKVSYELIGEPVDLKGAEKLAREDPYQFQWWALGLVGARPSETEKKKGADRGIDGCIYFHDNPNMKKTKQIILQVKGGHVNRGMIDALKGVVERENAEIGVFITLQKPTRPMIKEAVSGGFYKSPSGKSYPKIQILTVEDLLYNNKNIERPPKIAISDVTFKKAKQHIDNKFKQGKLLE